MLYAAAIQGRLRCVWWHTANEAMGLLPRHRAALARSLGVLAGTPDLVFVGATKAVLVELKTQTGRQSANQSLFQEWAVECGADYILCRSEGELTQALIARGLMTDRLPDRIGRR